MSYSGTTSDRSCRQGRRGRRNGMANVLTGIPTPDIETLISRFAESTIEDATRRRKSLTTKRGKNTECEENCSDYDKSDGYNSSDSYNSSDGSDGETDFAENLGSVSRLRLPLRPTRRFRSYTFS